MKTTTLLAALLLVAAPSALSEQAALPDDNRLLEHPRAASVRFAACYAAWVQPAEEDDDGILGWIWSDEDDDQQHDYCGDAPIDVPCDYDGTILGIWRTLGFATDLPKVAVEALFALRLREAGIDGDHKSYIFDGEHNRELFPSQVEEWAESGGYRHLACVIHEPQLVGCVRDVDLDGDGWVDDTPPFCLSVWIAEKLARMDGGWPTVGDKHRRQAEQAVQRWIESGRPPPPDWWHISGSSPLTSKVVERRVRDEAYKVNERALRQWLRARNLRIPLRKIVGRYSGHVGRDFYEDVATLASSEDGDSASELQDIIMRIEKYRETDGLQDILADGLDALRQAATGQQPIEAPLR